MLPGHAGPRGRLLAVRFALLQPLVGRLREAALWYAMFPTSKKYFYSLCWFLTFGFFLCARSCCFSGACGLDLKRRAGNVCGCPAHILELQAIGQAFMENPGRFRKQAHAAHSSDDGHHDGPDWGMHLPPEVGAAPEVAPVVDPSIVEYVSAPLVRMSVDLFS